MKILSKISIFAFLFSGFYFSTEDSDAKHHNHNHLKKHKMHHKGGCHVKNKNHNELNKYGKYFVGFGSSLGFSSAFSDSSSNIAFDQIETEAFNPANNAFPAFTYSPNYKIGFGSNMTFGYWMKNNLSVGLDLDYISNLNRQKSDDRGYIQSKIMSASVFMAFSKNIKNIVSPYVKLGIGFGMFNANGLIVNDGLVAAAINAGVANNISNTAIRFSGLNHSIGLIKAGLGVSKELTNHSEINLGYQFIKTSKITDGSSNMDAILGGGKLKNGSDFSFSDMSTPIHSVTLSFKSII